MSAEILTQLEELAELSGKEAKTASYLKNYIRENFDPEVSFYEWGLYNFSFHFEFSAPGKTILFRTDMDGIDAGSEVARHLCGHHGHMFSLLNLAKKMYSRRDELCGKAVFFFQSAEETGQGAATAIVAGMLDHYKPDYALAWHNIPGFPLKQVLYKDGIFAKASCGLKLVFKGKMAHASNPSSGINPAFVLPDLINHLQQDAHLYPECMYTLTHVKVGDATFGISPAYAETWLTLRSVSDNSLETYVKKICEMAFNLSGKLGLSFSYTLHEAFPVTLNNSDMIPVLRNVITDLKQDFLELENPFSWSEDFGHFGNKVPSLLFGLGAGENVAGLHEKDYRFPKVLADQAAEIFESLYMKLQARSAN